MSGDHCANRVCVHLEVFAAVLMGGAVLGCNGSGSGSDACISAGGRCVVGGAVNICTKLGPLGCNNDPPNPGGAFCCLEFLDAGDAGCSAPDATTYSCTPQAPDAGGCAPRGSDGGSSLLFPLGCMATLPGCSTFSNGASAQTCSCEVLFDAGPAWICPL
jgi:hypothetical protein